MQGAVTCFSLNVNAGRGVSDRRLAAFLKDKTIVFDAQGNFTLLLSKIEPNEVGQWVQISEDAASIMLRQYMNDPQLKRWSDRKYVDSYPRLASWTAFTEIDNDEMKAIEKALNEAASWTSNTLHRSKAG
jgi:hypothetical protein